MDKTMADVMNETLKRYPTLSITHVCDCDERYYTATESGVYRQKRVQLPKPKYDYHNCVYVQQRSELVEQASRNAIKELEENGHVYPDNRNVEDPVAYGDQVRAWNVAWNRAFGKHIEILAAPLLK